MKTILVFIGTIITAIIGTIATVGVKPTPTLIPIPTVYSSPSPVPKQKSVQTTSGNLINCIGPDGKIFQTTQMACDEFNLKWGKSNNTETVPNVGNSSSTNSTYSLGTYVCQIGSSGYITYTKDAASCIQKQTDEITYSTKTFNCKTQQQTDLNACLSPCNSTYDYGKNVCAIAYTGESATIANDTSKYGECLSENSAIWQSCTQPCYDKANTEFSSCINK